MALAGQKGKLVPAAHNHGAGDCIQHSHHRRKKPARAMVHSERDTCSSSGSSVGNECLRKASVSRFENCTFQQWVATLCTEAR